MIVDKDLIEKGAKAIRAAMLADPNCRLPPFEKDKVSPLIARAALQAVLPDVVEEAAKVAEGHDPNALVYRWVLARDIRSLLNKEDKANG